MKAPSHLRLVVNNEQPANVEELRLAYSAAIERWGKTRKELDRLAADNQRRRYIAALMGSEEAAARIIRPERKWGFN